MKHKPRIFTVIPNSEDATSWYRAVPALEHIRRTLNAEIVIADKINWPLVYSCDMLFMQRPCVMQHMQIAALFKQQGKPIVLDFDDAFFNIPEWNQAVKHYSDPNNINIIKNILSSADHIFVSTEHLKTLIKHLSKAEFHVIPNAYNDFIFGDLKMPATVAKKIVWRGGHTHREDLNTIGNEVIKLSHKYPFNWHFIGERPWFCSFMKEGSYSFTPPMDLMTYFSFITGLNAAAYIVPLVDNDFNRAKSNIAYIEAAQCGSMTFAQFLPEFKVPGCTTFTSASDFTNKLTQLLEGKVNVMKHVEEAQTYIRDNLLLSQVNQKRVEVFKQVLELE